MRSQSKPLRIAVDAMGGDYAPKEIVKGAVQAASSGDVQIVLVGDPQTVQSELAKHDTLDLPIGNIPAEGVISEEETPVLALRRKPRASILVATELVKEGHADAVVTMGSTGAAMAAATFILGTIEGLDRPVLGGPILGTAPKTVIIDVGTNVDCRPSQLVRFAIIGNVFARQFFSVENPRIALLSVGAEAGKGNRQIRETTELLEKSGLNFIGNLEAGDLPLGKAEVVVCDGFVGNIVMKLAEGLGDSIADHLRNSFQGRVPHKELEELAQEVIDITNLAENLGGGPLFGVKGVSIVGHGRSKAGAVARAIDTAKRVVELRFIDKLNEELSQMRERIET